MAYRRRHGTQRSLTFVDDSGSSSSSLFAADESTSDLTSQAYRGSSTAALHDAKQLTRSATYTAPKGTMTYEYTSVRSLNESKYGFWGVLARKAKAILENDDISQQFEDYGKSEQMIESSAPGQFNQSHYLRDSTSRTESHALNRSSETASSMHQISDSVKSALEEGSLMVENTTADNLKETRKLHIRRKSTSSLAFHQTADFSAPDYLYPNLNDHETQLKASRDVANAMAAKAKLLLRELKTVKADLAFAKERSAQLEEENKLLRESCEKGDNLEDDDLIRLQLETLLEEKARLAHENSIYAREDRFLREIVEYHQLTMQDVIYVDDEGIEEVITPIPRLSFCNSFGRLFPVISEPGSSNNSSLQCFHAEEIMTEGSFRAFRGSHSSPMTPAGDAAGVVLTEIKEESPLHSPSPQQQVLWRQHSFTPS